MEDAIRELIRDTLNRLGLYSKDAEYLIWRTGVAESGYRALAQTSGPAIGFWQCEPDTVEDIWVNYVVYREKYKKPLLTLGFDPNDITYSVMGNLNVQIALCRFKYYRDKQKIPSYKNLK